MRMAKRRHHRSGKMPQKCCKCVKTENTKKKRKNKSKTTTTKRSNKKQNHISYKTVARIQRGGKNMFRNVRNPASGMHSVLAPH